MILAELLIDAAKGNPSLSEESVKHLNALIAEHSFMIMNDMACAIRDMIETCKKYHHDYSPVIPVGQKVLEKYGVKFEQPVADNS